MEINLIFLLPSPPTLPSARVLTKEKSNFSSIISAPTRGKMKNIYYQLQPQPFEVAREIINKVRGGWVGNVKDCLIKMFVSANLWINFRSAPNSRFVYSRKITFHSSRFCSNLLKLQLARKADKAHFVSDKIQIESTDEWKLNSFGKNTRPTFKSGKNENRKFVNEKLPFTKQIISEMFVFASESGEWRH